MTIKLLWKKEKHTYSQQFDFFTLYTYVNAILASWGCLIVLSMFKLDVNLRPWGFQGAGSEGPRT